MSRPPGRPGGRGALGWLAVAAALGLVATLGAAFQPEALDWQPGRAWREPWRLVTAVGVHYGPRHLFANLAGLSLVALLGVAARPPRRLALAWCLAWPATQLGLSARPELLHFGGLSGVLHAGVAIVATFLVLCGTRAQRAVGAAIAVGLGAKIASEAPFGTVLRQVPGWDILVVPLAHAVGAVTGTLAAALLLRFGGAGARGSDESCRAGV